MPTAIKAADLETHFAGAVWRWLAERGLFHVEEFVTPWGVADVLGIRFNNDRVQMRIAAGQMDAVNDAHAMQLLLSLPEGGKPKSVSAVACQFESLLGSALLERAVRGLIRKRFMVQREETFMRRTDWMPYHEQLVAVELKLRRVDEALAQARRHKAITPESYVGMPAVIAERIAFTERRADFEKAGVGLLSIQDGVCNILISPDRSKNSVIKVQELCAAEACWRTVLKTVQH